jgi:hypothetical protein
MRSMLAMAALILGVTAVVPQARAQRHELYWQAGADFLNGPNELIAGIGGGPGYRFLASESWQLMAETRFLVMAGNRVSMAVGGAYEFGSGSWRPSVGIFGHLYLGHRLLIIDSDDPEPASLPAVALALRLSPLQFTNARYSVTALALSPAVGVTSSPLPVGFSLTLLAVGARF